MFNMLDKSVKTKMNVKLLKLKLKLVKLKA